MRYFTSPEFPGEEFDAPAYGEELVMSITARLFGRPLNQLHESPVTVPYFQRRPWWHLWVTGGAHGPLGRRRLMGTLCEMLGR